MNRRGLLDVALALTLLLASVIFTDAAAAASVRSPAQTSQAQAIVNAAASQAGLTYCWDGGTSTRPSHGDGDYDGEAPDCINPDTIGFDCSGLALYAVYQATRITLPHSAAEQGADYAEYGGTLISSQSSPSLVTWCTSAAGP
jgi:cell wall-associated NlpC family hydrolase